MRAATSSQTQASISDDATFERLRATFGSVLARPVATGGVVTLAHGLPMTAAHLAKLEAAWRFEGLQD